MRLFTSLLMALLLVPSALAKDSTEVLLTFSAGLARYSASGDFIGGKSAESMSESDFPGAAGLGVRFFGRYTLEVSSVELEFFPFLTDVAYGVRGSATRWLAGYQHPVNDWLAVGIRGGVMDWEVEVKPSIFHGWSSHSGRDPYYGILLRMGSNRLAFLLGHDRSHFEDIALRMTWVGLEIVPASW